MSRQKAARSAQVYDQPAKEVCPICTLPMHKVAKVDGKTVAQKGCTFFARCAAIKYADDPKKSARLRSIAFRRFHDDICSTCKLPKEVCREKKVRKAMRDAKAKGRYLTPGDVTAEANLIGCEPPDRHKYTPKTPDWYTQE